MPQPRHIPSLLLTGLVLAGCQAVPVAPAPASVAPAPAERPATGVARVTPSFRDGAVRRLLTAYTAYTQASINHMQVKLFTVTAGPTETQVGSTVDVAAADLTKTITFGNLAHNTDYRIRAYAYLTAGTTTPISDDATSYVDVSVATDDAPALGNLVVSLIDQTFSGSTTSDGLTVNNGAIVHSGNETITVNP